MAFFDPDRQIMKGGDAAQKTSASIIFSPIKKKIRIMIADMVVAKF
jgi:hypothetical protein